jgi:hypothetical protein
MVSVGEWVIVVYAADVVKSDENMMVISTPRNQPFHRSLGLITMANDIEYFRPSFEDVDP